MRLQVIIVQASPDSGLGANLGLAIVILLLIPAFKKQLYDEPETAAV